MANTELGSAYVTLIPSMKGFQAGVGKEVQAVGGALSSFGKIAAAAGAAVAGLGFAGLAGDAIDASDATDKFKQTLDFAGLDTGTIDALAASTRKYADETVYSLSDIQSITAQLASNGVKDYDKLAMAAGNLNAAAGGTADTYKTVGMVLTQTAGLGKLTTENWNQLSEAIPGASGMLKQAMLEAGAYTGNFNEAMEAGEITAQEFSDAIMKLGMTDAAQEAATSTATMEGALGNLQAAAQGLVMDGFDKIKPAVTGAINGATAAIEAASPAVLAAMDGMLSAAQQGMARIGGVLEGAQQAWRVGDTIPEKLRLALSYAANVASQGMDQLTAVVQQRLNGVGERFSALKPVTDFVSGLVDSAGGLGGVATKVAGVAAAFAGLSAVRSLAGPISAVVVAFQRFQGLSQVTGTLTALQASFGRLLPSISGVRNALALLASPVGIALAAVAALAAGFAYFYTTNETFRNGINQIAAALGSMLAPMLAQIGATLASFGATVLPVIMSLMQQIAPIVMQIITVVAELAAFLVPMIAQIVATVLPAVTTIVQAVVQFAAQILSVVLPVVEAILSAVQTAMPVIMTVISAALTAIQAVFAAVWPVVQSIVEVTLGAIQAVVNTVWPAIQAVIDTVMGAIRTVITAVMQAISGDWEGAWNTIKGALDAAWEGIKGGVSAGIDAVLGFMSDLPGNILSALGDLGGLLVSAGSDLINGLKKGVMSAIDGVVSAVTGGVGRVVDAAKGLLGIASPSKVFAEIGSYAMEGMARGIARAAGDPVDAVKGVMADVSDLAPKFDPWAGFNPNVRIPSVADGGAGGKNLSQTFVFNQPVKSPDEVARALRMQERYGLAAQF